VTRCLAILAESDTAFRRLLAKVLTGVRCEVAECSSGPELCAELHRETDANVERLLLVSSTLLASACADEISDLARARDSGGLSVMQVLLVCEFGAGERPLPDLGSAKLVGALEKPFDIDALEALVSRAPNGPGTESPNLSALSS
jgi:CheY-like chemotaxis protein